MIHGVETFARITTDATQFATVYEAVTDLPLIWGRLSDVLSYPGSWCDPDAQEQFDRWVAERDTETQERAW